VLLAFLSLSFVVQFKLWLIVDHVRAGTGNVEMKSNSSNGRTVCRADGNQEDVSQLIFWFCLIT